MVVSRHSFCLLVISVALSASVAFSEELTPSFLAGRIVGGSAHDLHLTPLQSPNASHYQAHASDIWRSGSKDWIESRLIINGAARYDAWDWRLHLLNWEGDLRPVDEIMLNWDWRLSNSWFGFNGDGDGWSHGFEPGSGFELRQKIALTYLQRKGRIRVDRPQYPLLFYRNPILNKKQHSWSILESHAFAPTGILADSLGFGWRYGLTRAVEFGSSLVAGRSAVQEDKWETSSWENRTRFWLTSFWGPLRTEVGSVLELWTVESGAGKLRDLDLVFDLVLFGGDRLFSEVAGNWDGLFDRTALPGQLLLSAEARAWDTRNRFENFDQGPDSLRVSGLLGLPWGFSLDGGALYTEDWIWGVGVAWLGTPLRSGGPERVRAMEYLYGSIPPPWGSFLQADLWDDGALWGNFDWLVGLPYGNFFAVYGAWNFDLNGPAYIGGAWGYGNHHWRVQLGSQHRWLAGMECVAIPWRIDRNRQPMRSLYERTLGEPPFALDGWSLNFAFRSWF